MGFDISDIIGMLAGGQQAQQQQNQTQQPTGGIDLSDLLGGGFLEKFTNAGDLGELLKKLGMDDQTQIPDAYNDETKKAELDQKVDQNTQFSSLEDMLKKAITQAQQQAPQSNQTTTNAQVSADDLPNKIPTQLPGDTSASASETTSSNPLDEILKHFTGR